MTATEDTTGWTTWVLHDPHLGMPLLGLRHPPEWRSNGQVTWVPQESESPEHHWYEVTNPSRVAAVQCWPRFDFTWPGGAPWQPNSYGRVYLPPTAPDRLLGSLIPQLLGAGAGQPTAFEVRPLPDWAERFHLSADQLAPGVTYTGLHSRLDAAIDGRPWRLEILGFHFSVSNSAPLGMITNHGLFLTVLRADVAAFDQLRPTLYAILDSATPNPAWLAAVNQVGQADGAAFEARQAGARWAAFQAEQASIAKVGAAAADLRATQAGNAQASFDAMMRPPSGSGSAGVSAQQAWRNELGGVTAVEDPTSREGNTKNVSSGSAVTWQNENGEVIETDDVNLDPNINSQTTWKVVRRY